MKIQLLRRFACGLLILLAATARLTAVVPGLDYRTLDCAVFSPKDATTYTKKTGSLGETGFVPGVVQQSSYRTANSGLDGSPIASEVAAVDGQTIIPLETWVYYKESEVSLGISLLGNFERSNATYTVAGVSWVIIHFRGGASGGSFGSGTGEAPPPLVNLSFRAVVPTGGGQIIPGFVLTKASTVLVRAGGPYLAGFGVTGTHPNPAMRLFSEGTVIASNDDWENQIPSPVNTSTKADILATQAKVGTAPYAAGSKDTALLLTLPAGAYTAFIEGGAGNTKDGGEVIVEVFWVK